MVTLKRSTTWRADLASYIDSVMGREFDRAVFHCGFFPADAIIAMTGTDLAKPWRHLRTLEGQLRAIRRLGFENHVDLTASLLPELDHPSRASIGDVAAFSTDDCLGWAMGVVIGERCMVLREGGLGSLETLSAGRVFKV